MPELRQKPRLAEPGLTMIDLPWMDIKNKGLPFLLINTLEGKLGKPVGEKAKITAPGNWNFFAEKKGRRDGKLL
jgi:hypothetical protein